MFQEVVKFTWSCGGFVVKLWWTCGGLVVDLWLSCGEVVVKNNSRFVPICGGTCGDIVAIIYHTKHHKYKSFSPHLWTVGINIY